MNAEHRLRSSIDAALRSAEAVIVVQLDGRVTDVNPDAESLFGRAASELVGQSLRGLFPTSAWPEVERTLQRVARSEEVPRTYLYSSPDEPNRLSLLITASPLFDEVGGVHGARLIVRDLDQIRRQTNPELRLAAIVQWCDDAIVGKTLDGTITSWNRAAEKMFGHREAEAIGKSIKIIIPRERWGEEDHVLDRVVSGSIVDHFETIRMRNDGTPVEISLTVSPIRDERGRIVGASKIARDVSERRRLEAAKAAADEQIAAMLEQSQAANRAKDEFLATLSHELRTPLNAILGWSELLRLQSNDRDLLERGLAIISANVKGQTRLIEDLLDISRIVAGKMRLEIRPCSVVTVIEAALEAIQPAARSKRIQIDKRLPTDVVVTGDPDRLQQVVWNLLSNAVRFTPENGRVEIVLARSNGQVEISVSDSGIGISPEFLPHVFERFRQADSSSQRKVGGLGLGLAIARDLVELHGGSLQAASPGVDRGALFTVRLPATVSEPQRQAPARGERGTVEPAWHGLNPDLRGVHVLFVDDDPGAREMATEILRTFGAEVTVASSAAEALARLKERKPDVLLSDIGMPEEDGYALIERIRQLPWWQGGAIPAAAVTAYGSKDDRWRALAAGFQIHLAKPVDPLGLATTVANLSGRRLPTG